MSHVCNAMTIRFACLDELDARSLVVQTLRRFFIYFCKFIIIRAAIDIHLRKKRNISSCGLKKVTCRCVQFMEMYIISIIN